MAKDPAFLFYSKDFYEGTRMMLPEERACLLDLMIYQHQNGVIPLDLSRVKMYCSGVNEATLQATLEAKFKKTDQGWINVKLESVVNDRKEFSDKQSDNGLIGQFFKKAKKNLAAKQYNQLKHFIYSIFLKENLIKELKKNTDYEAMLQAMLNAMHKHLANENEIGNGIEDEIEEGGTGEEDVLNHLNSAAGKKYKPTHANLKFIRARFGEKYTVDDLKSVIDVKVQVWKGDASWDKFLRPETLFNATKFQTYIQEAEQFKINPEKFKKNGTHQQTNSNHTRGDTTSQKRGTSSDRIEALKKW